MKRPASDSPDWAGDALADFLQVVRELAHIACWAVVLVVAVALAFAMVDLPK